MRDLKAPGSDQMPPFPTGPAEIADEIGLPLADWPGNCHAVAERVLRRIPTQGMRLVRGHFHGWTSPASVYGRGPQQHSWLRLQDGRVLDPTRWAFDQPGKPYLYVGENDAYDEAGLWLAARSRPAIRMAQFLRPDRDAPERAVAGLIEAAGPGTREALAAASGIARLARGPVSVPDAGALRDLLSAPVEHLEAPGPLYAAAAEAGLKSQIKLDLWVRVMEPDRVRPERGVNRFFADPPGERLSGPQALFRVLARFLSIEERDGLEGELEERGYRLEELHAALNGMGAVLRSDPDLTWMPRGDRDLLAVVAADLLGAGHGEALRVERYAESLGLDRDGLDRELRRFGAAAGYSLLWLPDRTVPEQATPAPA
jgi:hypothetical protein